MTKSNQKFYRIYGIWAKHKFIIIPFVWPSHFRFSSASCLRGRLGGRGRNKSGKKRQIICIVEQQAEAECWKLAASWKPYPYSWNVDKSWMYQLGLRYKLFPDADRKHPIFNRFQPAGWPYPVCIFLSQDIALSLTCSYRFHCQVSPTSKRGGQMTTNFPPIVYRPFVWQVGCHRHRRPLNSSERYKKLATFLQVSIARTLDFDPEQDVFLGPVLAFFPPSPVHIFILHMLKFHEVRQL